MKSKLYKICTIGGDGIGPEVINKAVKLLQITGLNFQFTEAEAGFGCYQKYGTPLPDQTVKTCQQSDAVLFGAVTTPPNIEGYFSPIVKLRKLLNTYANVRPFFSLPIPDCRQNIDFVIIRENTEGLYSGRERLTEDGAITERVITKKASERIVDFAFKLAIKQKRKKVTALHKANVMRLSDGLFLKIARDVAGSYPKIIFEDMLVDSCALQLIMKPESFDVIVTTNMFGDILSDEASALVGGLGVAASVNVGDNIALCEPVHGSAPKYTGQNRANPLATFFATCMMLEFLGENKMAGKIRKAIDQTLRKECMTVDLGGKATMSEFTKEVITQFKI